MANVFTIKIPEAELFPPAAQLVSETCEKFTVKKPPFPHNLVVSAGSCANNNYAGIKTSTRSKFLHVNFVMRLIIIKKYFLTNQ
jgi:hypothetical protein